MVLTEERQSFAWRTGYRRSASEPIERAFDFDDLSSQLLILFGLDELHISKGETTLAITQLRVTHVPFGGLLVGVR